MDAVLVDRANFLVAALDHSPTHRLLVAIAGVPASGKSTFAARLVEHTNALLARARTAPGASESASNPAQAVLIGQDGWHLTRAQLDAMDDPQRAHDRRGSHWTFDAHAYVDFIARLRCPSDAQDLGSSSSVVVHAPAFDHALKDPTPDALVVRPAHRIVVVEGLYAILDVDPWRRAAAQMDHRWWITIDAARARSRLVRRHVETGVARDEVEAVWRAEHNDEENGRFVANNLFDVTYTIESVDEPAKA